MALKQLLIARRISELEAERQSLTAEYVEISGRREKWREREAAAVSALEEIDETTGAEERAAFEAETREIATLDTELCELEEKNSERVSAVDSELEALRSELSEIENRSKTHKVTSKTTVTKGENEMNIYNIPEYRSACREAARSDGGARFLEDVKAIMRGVSNVKLTVPTVMLPIVRERIGNYSKLKSLVNLKPIRGEGRQPILGAAPEAVWTETAGAFNELALDVAMVNLDGAKVAGMIPVPNPYLEDSNEDLAAIVLDYLGQSIGLALDKAIIYGTGKNMPVGIVTRLTQTTSPSWWDANAPAFTNLSASNVGKLSATSVTGTAAITEMLKILRKTKATYNVGNEERTWIMNQATWDGLKIDTLATNSAGAIVAGLDDRMPIIGGKVVTLEFIPDNVVVGGYLGHYTLGERAGVELRRSEHYRFGQDQTTFAGVARYDGKPISGEAFAAFSLSTTAISGTAVTFAEDTANKGEE